MYLNEKAWEIQQDDQYIIDTALKEFLKIYSSLAKDFGISGIYVPADMDIYLHSNNYPLAKWLSEVDIEYRRLYLSLWARRIYLLHHGICGLPVFLAEFSLFPSIKTSIY